MVKMSQQFALKPIKALLRRSLDPDETISTDLGEIEFDKLARGHGRPWRAGRGSARAARAR